MSTVSSAYNQFCTERFSLPTEAQLAALEQRIGVSFPDDYRGFLLQFNGGYFDEPDIVVPDDGFPADALTALAGIGASDPEAELGDEASLSIFDDNDPPQMLPIGFTIMGGLILLVTRPEGRGNILLKEPYGEFYALANGIAEFFDLLRDQVDD